VDDLVMPEGPESVEQPTDQLDAADDAEVLPDWATWAPPWDSVSAKLVHAWRHFTLLTSTSREFVQRPPLSTEAFAAPEHGPNWLRFDLLVTHPDPNIALTLGDFLHNVRCALDHSLTAIDAKAGRNLNFPTALSEADFDTWAEKWTKAGGTDGALAAIRLRQPFHAPEGQDPEDYVLRTVARLNNTDKHRLLHTTPVGLSDEKPPNLAIKTSANVVRSEYLLAAGWPLEERQAALLVEFDCPVTQLFAELEGTIPIGVSVERYGDVVSLGADLHQGVRRACRRLRQGSLDGWP
jgi:hypothetical protein